MDDKEKFLRLAAMDIVKSSEIRDLKISRDELMDIYIKHPGYDAIILFLKNAHPDILDAIVRNGDDRIKCFVCQKYPLLDKTYDFLLQQHEEVRLDLCANKKLPDFAKEKLLSDASERVRSKMNQMIGYDK